MVVTLDLPDGDGLKAGSTPLMYQGLEVGQLSKLNLNPGGKVTGEMTVDPSVVTLLREKTLIQMKKPKLSSITPALAPCSPAIPLSWCPAKASHAITSR
nr:mce related protein [Klebsiella pneumoniae]